MAYEEKNLGVNGKVWTTYSNVSNFIFGSILSLQMAENDVLSPANLDLEMVSITFTFISRLKQLILDNICLPSNYRRKKYF